MEFEESFKNKTHLQNLHKHYSYRLKFVKNCPYACQLLAHTNWNFIFLLDFWKRKTKKRKNRIRAAVATCKPWNQAFAILEISCNSKCGPNMAISLLEKKIVKHPNGFRFESRLTSGCRALNKKILQQYYHRNVIFF